VIYTTSDIEITSTLPTDLPGTQEWITILSEFLIDLPHLPTSISRGEYSLLLPNYRSRITGLSTASLQTRYGVRFSRPSLDGEVLTAFGLYLHKYRDEKHPNRVYLDQEFASCLGNLDINRNSSLSKVLRRLQTTWHRIVINDKILVFKALTRIVTDVATPYVEIEPYLSEAFSMALTKGEFLNFHISSHSSIRHPVNRRLFRYLERTGNWDISVKDLAAVLGIYTASPGKRIFDDFAYAKIPPWNQTHRAITRTLSELIELGYLETIEFEGTGENRIAHIYSAL